MLINEIRLHTFQLMYMIEDYQRLRLIPADQAPIDDLA